jgi:hypothetical protein
VLGRSGSDDDVVVARQLPAVPLQVSLTTLAHLLSTSFHSLASEENENKIEENFNHNQTLPSNVCVTPASGRQAAHRLPRPPTQQKIKRKIASK